MRPITPASRLARSALVAGAAAIVAATPVASVGTTSTGPSSSASPYVVRSSRASRHIILSVGDNIDGYRLVGIPDGLGVLGTDDGAFRLFVTHELFADVGIARAHGGTGDFRVGLHDRCRHPRVPRAPTSPSVLVVGRHGGLRTAPGSLRNLNGCSANLAAKSALDPIPRTGYNRGLPER